MIGLGPMRNMPHKRCPLLILRHIDLAKHRCKYEADLARMREDLANMFKSKLGLDIGRSWLYQGPYVDAFDLIPYPAGWRVPDFVKFSGDDN